MEKPKPLKCDQCVKSFDSKRNLVKHYNSSAHIKQVPSSEQIIRHGIKCELCDYTASSNYFINVHGFAFFQQYPKARSHHHKFTHRVG